MSQEFIQASPDLKMLWDEGYEIEIKHQYLLVHHIPYLNSELRVLYGTLVMPLTVAGDKVIQPANHVAYFKGAVPYKADGSIIFQINSSEPQTFAPGVDINHTFSRKPPGGYKSFYEKVTTYDTLLSSHARKVDPNATAKTFKVIESTDESSPLHYHDANSTRGFIHPISAKLNNLKVAIVGLGGTGSYVLDSVSKTLVEEIHLCDGDYLGQHNAFRSPGAPSVEELRARYKKVDYFTAIYSKMHKGIKPHAEFITDENVSLLTDMQFVFICIDHGASRRIVINFLLANKIPFVDVGIGVHKEDLNLLGHIRTTLVTPEKADHVDSRINFDDGGENDYSTNIQIAELNAINAALAVMKWKKYYGIYRDSALEFNSTFSIADAKIFHKEAAA